MSCRFSANHLHAVARFQQQAAREKRSSAQLARFRRLVLGFFARNARSFPWRTNPSPYRVLVSELMLQQTQAERVVPKFEAFLKDFPTVRHLASARERDVLEAWQGLGYNRRALNLKRAAESVHEQYQGQIPEEEDLLRDLPGVGPYTASAIRAFAFNKRAVLIETNVRSVFVHFFFPKKQAVSDSQLLPLIERSLPRSNFRRWYSALMDYGAALKQFDRGLNARSAHYVRQTSFEGSNRQLRGKIVRILLEREWIAPEKLAEHLALDAATLERCIEGLVRDELVQRSARRISIIRT